MTNVWVMYGPYSREENHYLFGYTYIPKEKPEDNKEEYQNITSEESVEKKQIGRFTFVFK